MRRSRGFVRFPGFGAALFLLLFFSSGVFAQYSGQLPVAAQHTIEDFGLPFFFGVPAELFLDEGKFLKLDERIYPQNPLLILPSRDFKKRAVGLRVYLIDGEVRDRDPVAASKALYRDGLIQDGDVVLSFRPEWIGTGPYPNLQMGISHAGLLFVDEENELIANVDMPLNFSGYLDDRFQSPGHQHYRDADTLHILRPDISETEKANVKKWAFRFRDRLRQGRQQLTFKTEYMNPLFRGNVDFLRTFRNIGLGIDKTSTLSMYCSEFVWSVLSLRKIDPDAADASRMDVALEDVIFEPMPGIGDGRTPGLAEGPRFIMNYMGISSVGDYLRTVEEIFTEGDPQKMSAGHRAVNAQIKPLMDAVKPYYQYMINFPEEYPAEAKRAAEIVNARMPPNYSPTSFLINALLPNLPARPEAKVFDYVATVVFVGEKTEPIRREPKSEDYLGDDEAYQEALEAFQAEEVLQGKALFTRAEDLYRAWKERE